jgi:hypothetical protein
MSDSTQNLDQVSATAVQRETAINALLDAASPATIFGRRASTSAALAFGYYGGRMNGTSVANGAVTATASNTNYVVAHRSTLAVTISTSNTNWNDTTTYGRMYLLTAGASSVTAYEDHRFGTGGILTGVGASYSPSQAVNAQTGTTYTIVAGDLSKLVTFSNASSIAVTLPQATGSFAAGFYADLKNIGVGAVTITPTTSTINGAATLVLNTGQSVRVVSDGTNYQTSILPPGPLVNAQTGTTYTYLAGDRGKLVTHTNASAIAGTLPQATGAFGVNWHVWVQNRGAGTLTITPTTSTIDGAATLVLGVNQGALIVSDGTNYYTCRDAARETKVIQIAVGDETTAITTGTAKVTFRMPYAMTLTAVRASLTTVSSSGTPTIDINEDGSTILSTKLTIDASEKTSTTAATAAVISDSALADDAEITIDIDTAGTGAAGLKVALIGY